MASLASLISSTQKGFLKNVLEGAGLALGTSAISITLLRTAVDHLKDSFGSVSVSLLQLIGLSGFDVYLGLVIGAIVAVQIQNSGSLLLQKIRR